MKDTLQKKEAKYGEPTKAQNRETDGEKELPRTFTRSYSRYFEFLFSVHKSSRKKLNKLKNSMEWSYGTTHVMGCFFTDYLQYIFISKV
jgi:hypothetical protein